VTKRDAFAEACRRWFTNGTTPDDVVAWASRGRNSPIYRVGARTRGGTLIAYGASDASWEEAFADHDRRRIGAS
jgi:hypothetical protein